MTFGSMKGKDIVVMEGRIHPYEVSLRTINDQYII